MTQYSLKLPFLGMFVVAIVLVCGRLVGYGNLLTILYVGSILPALIIIVRELRHPHAGLGINFMVVVAIQVAWYVLFLCTPDQFLTYAPYLPSSYAYDLLYPSSGGGYFGDLRSVFFDIPFISFIPNSLLLGAACILVSRARRRYRARTVLSQEDR